MLFRSRNVASQLTALLADPQTHVILATAPPHARAAFARALATPARLLAIDLPPLLQRPTKPRPPRPARPRPARPKSARPKPARPVLPPLIPPIPANVRAAARAWNRKPR